MSAEILSKCIKAWETPVTSSRLEQPMLNIPNVDMANLQGNGDNWFFPHRFHIEVGNTYTVSSSVKKHSKGTFKFKNRPNAKNIFYRKICYFK